MLLISLATVSCSQLSCFHQDQNTQLHIYIRCFCNLSVICIVSEDFLTKDLGFKTIFTAGNCTAVFIANQPLIGFAMMLFAAITLAVVVLVLWRVVKKLTQRKPGKGINLAPSCASMAEVLTKRVEMSRSQTCTMYKVNGKWVSTTWGEFFEQCRKLAVRLCSTENGGLGLT